MLTNAENDHKSSAIVKHSQTFMVLVAGFTQAVIVPERRNMKFEIGNLLPKHYFQAQFDVVPKKKTLLNIKRWRMRMQLCCEVMEAMNATDL